MALNTQNLYKKTALILLTLGVLELLVGLYYVCVIRSELYMPAMASVSPNFFNLFTTIHGLLMSFLAIYPIGLGLAVWSIPKIVYSKDFINTKACFFVAIGLVAVGVIFTILSMTVYDQANPQLGWSFYSEESNKFNINHLIVVSILIIVLFVLTSLILSAIIAVVVKNKKTLWPFSIRTIFASIITIIATLSLGRLIWISINLLANFKGIAI